LDIERDTLMSADGLRLSCLDCVPAAPDDVLVHVHGLESHNEWFRDLAHACARHGIGFSGLDRRGSGMSAGTPGDASSNEALLDDIDRGVDRACQRWPSSRVHLVGLCLGARLATLYAERHAPKIASLILVSPSFHLSRRARVPLWRRLRLAMDAWRRPAAQFPSPLDDSMFSDKQEALEFLAHDARKLKSGSARFLYNLFGRVTTRDLLATLERLPLRTLVVCAGPGDRVLDTERIRREIVELSARAPNLRLTVLADSQHLIYFDALEAIVAELETHVKGPLRKQ
jgi:alpha-beta hydrolase superfamily lysophospholipase